MNKVYRIYTVLHFAEEREGEYGTAIWAGSTGEAGELREAYLASLGTGCNKMGNRVWSQYDCHGSPEPGLCDG